MSKSAPYSFERKRYSYRDEKRTEESLQAFITRLGLPSDVSPEIKKALIDYITDVHLRIAWYATKLTREKNLSSFYIIVTIGLLGAIPILLFYITGLDQMKGTEFWVAQISAVLSGFLGVHKGFSNWLEQRRVIADFWKAMADLKEALYELEDKHRKDEGETWTEKDLEDLKKDLALGSKFAQKVERRERDQFFKNYKTPKFDLLGTLYSTGKKTEDLTELFLNPGAQSELLSQEFAAEMAQELLEAQTEVIQYEFETAELAKRVEAKAREIESAPEEELSALKAALKELQVKMERAEVNLISAKGRVKALQNALGIEAPIDDPVSD